MADAAERELPGTALSKERGRRQREELPRADLAALPDRPEGFDPIAVLEAQAAHRDAALLPLRYERMAEDPLGFLRGSAAIMAADLAAGRATALQAQLCGDAHLSNFGVFRSPEGRWVFDVDDFDETCPGPFEWDVKRLCASVVVAAEAVGAGESECERAAVATAAEYRVAVRAYAKASTLSTWTDRIELSRMLGRRFKGVLVARDAVRAERSLASESPRGRRGSYARLLAADGAAHFASAPPLLVPVRELPAAEGGEDRYRFLVEVLHGYAESLPLAGRRLLDQFTPVDAARKVVGVGSVGLRCFVVLLLGRDADDPFVLQVKEAVPSVLERPRAAAAGSSGRRVVEGQQAIQATPDPFLGWLDVDDPQGAARSYYVRQFYDGKATADLPRFDGGLLRGYGALCGWTLAHAHARTTDRVALASYLGKSDVFETAIGAFAVAYARRNRADHAALLAALKEGRLPKAPRT